jgi:hypothetical protein
VILPKKEYRVFDPFTEGFLAYSARADGRFHGSWGSTKFEGLHIEIEGPSSKVVVYISKEGDMVKVDLPKGESLILDALPNARDPLFLKLDGHG